MRTIVFDKMVCLLTSFSVFLTLSCSEKEINPVLVTSITLDTTLMELFEGESQSLVATICPSDADNHKVLWSSSDEAVASVCDGLVTAVGAGKAIITAKSEEGGKTAICELIVKAFSDYIDEYSINHGQGVKIDGVVWAPVNCGYHSTDYKYGKLYQWGRKYGQGFNGIFYDYDNDNGLFYNDKDGSVPTLVTGSVSLEIGQSILNADKFYCFPMYDWIVPNNKELWNMGTEENPVKTEYDPCPAGWRVPTHSELSNLSSNCSSWTTNDGKNGCWYSGSSLYSESVPRIFLPAAGVRWGADRGCEASGRGYLGGYWQSYSSLSSTDVLTLDVIPEPRHRMAYHDCGLSVRCVQDLSKSSIEKVDYVDEYGINHGQGVEIDGAIWAPVNCGYHSTDYKYGKLYQWGRKYGQGYEGPLQDINGNQIDTYSDASVPSIVAGPVSLTIGQSESNSNSFYASAPYSSAFDWLTPQNDALWNIGTEDVPVKTEFDPCPSGWRVPTYTELSNLSSNYSSWTNNAGQNGCWFSGSATYSESVLSVFFLAAGVHYSNGTAIRGDCGLYWSSSSNSNQAYSLDFYSSNARMFSNSRSFGLSVRCVQE